MDQYKFEQDFNYCVYDFEGEDDWRFGFVRYDHKEAVELAIAETNWLWVESNSSIVRRTSYDKGATNIRPIWGILQDNSAFYSILESVNICSTSSNSNTQYAYWATIIPNLEQFTKQQID